MTNLCVCICVCVGSVLYNPPFGVMAIQKVILFKSMLGFKAITMTCSHDHIVFEE